MTFSPKRQTSFDLAVEEARLAYLESQEGQEQGLVLAGLAAYKKLHEAISNEGELANRRKPRVYASPNVTKQTGKFYDLEFCLWLQHNFDYLLAHHQEFPGFKLWQGMGE